MAVNFLTSGWGDIENWMGFGGPPRYTAAPDALPVQPHDTGMLDVSSDSSADNLRLASPNPMAKSTSMQGMGLLMAGIGAVGSAVGAYYQAQSQQYSLKSQALNYQYQSDIARVNARSAEYDAQSVLEASKTQIGSYTMQAGQAKAGAKTEMAGRGLVLGSGSTAEVEASMDLVKDINVLTINSNAVRAAAADRTVEQNYRGQALMDDVSAANLRRSADSISPFGTAFGTLLSSASNIGMTWLSGQNKTMLAQGGY